MIRYILVSVALLCSALLSSPNRPTPQKYLDKTVLNTDKVVGFAGNALSLELENPPLKTTGEDAGKTAMTRIEVIKQKIQFSKRILVDLKYIYTEPDASDIVTSSIAMHEFLIGVYETEYMELAELYDAGAPKSQTDALDNIIKSKYASMFELHYENLIRGGKLYASKHYKQVKWRQA